MSGLPMMSYGCRFPAMIADWRKKWNEGSMGQTATDFPFGFVNLGATTSGSFSRSWSDSCSLVDAAPWKNLNNAPASVRWAQTAGYGAVPNKAMPNTFTAIALDLTDNTSPYGSVHIRDKTTVGERLAAAGIKAAYGAADAYVQGPTVGAATLKSPGVVQLSMDNVGTAGEPLSLSVSVSVSVCLSLSLFQRRSVHQCVS